MRVLYKMTGVGKYQVILKSLFRKLSLFFILFPTRFSSDSTNSAKEKKMSSPIYLIIQLLFFLATVFAGLPNTSPHHVKLNRRNSTVLEHAATGVKLEFVTNSGICETTPGVNQYSGYISLEPDQHTWFWL